MPTVRDALNYIYSYEIVEFIRKIDLLPMQCALGQVAMLAQQGLLRPSLLAGFNQKVIDTWQQVDSVYDFLSDEGLAELNEATRSAGLNASASCSNEDGIQD